MPEFQIVSDFHPTGDQPAAVDKLAFGVDRGDRYQTLTASALIEAERMGFQCRNACPLIQPD